MCERVNRIPFGVEFSILADAEENFEAGVNIVGKMRELRLVADSSCGD